MRWRTLSKRLLYVGLRRASIKACGRHSVSVKTSGGDVSGAGLYLLNDYTSKAVSNEDDRPATLLVGKFLLLSEPLKGR